MKITLYCMHIGFIIIFHWTHLGSNFIKLLGRTFCWANAKQEMSGLTVTAMVKYDVLVVSQFLLSKVFVLSEFLCLQALLQAQIHRAVKQKTLLRKFLCWAKNKECMANMIRSNKMHGMYIMCACCVCCVHYMAWCQCANCLDAVKTITPVTLRNRWHFNTLQLIKKWHAMITPGW